MVDVSLDDGQLFTFPEELYRALFRVRDPARSQLLFADSICINQTDEREKSLQVRMMRQIYQKARHVLIFLGDQDAHLAQSAFHLASQIRAQRLDELPMPNAGAWGELIQLFDRPWFGRVWCLQEVVLSRSAEVIWGPASAPWGDIGFVAAWICNVGYKVLVVWL